MAWYIIFTSDSVASTISSTLTVMYNNSISSTMRFIHINEYEYMNNYAQYIILHTRIRIQ